MNAPFARIGLMLVGLVLLSLAPAAEIVSAQAGPRGSFDWGGVPGTVKAGQVLAVPVTHIDDGAAIELRHWRVASDGGWTDVQRAELEVADAKVELVIPERLGRCVLQLSSSAHRAKSHVIVTVVEADAPVEPGPEPPPAQGLDLVDGFGPLAAHDGPVVSITPGDGWAGPTAAPEPVGRSDVPVIARWNVVPQRQIEGRFTLGVVAHHLDGVERVEFAVDGGPWATVFAPSVNPRTKCAEYWASLDTAGLPTGWIEVRAIAYPRLGKPTVLPAIELHVGDGPDFRAVALDAGTHDLKQITEALGKQARGWVTITAKPGLSAEQVVLTGGALGLKDRHLRLAGVTWRPSTWDEINGKDSDNSWAWLDGVTVEGRNSPRWLVHMSGRQIYTDCTLGGVAAVFHGGGRELLARNVRITHAIEDVCRANGLMVNVKIDRIDRGQFTDRHPDLFQWYGWELNGFIAQDVTSAHNDGQGLFSGDIANSAFVRVKVNAQGSYRALQMQGTTKDVLIEDCLFQGPANLRADKGFNVPPGHRLVIRRSLVNLAAKDAAQRGVVIE